MYGNITFSILTILYLLFVEQKKRISDSRIVCIEIEQKTEYFKTQCFIFD